MFGLGLDIWRGVKGVGGNGGAAVPPSPSTTNFTSAQILASFNGPITNDGTKIHMRQSRTLWAGFITGTDAKLTATTDFGDFDSVIQVAIDGGAFGLAPRTGQVFTLFSGLSHATRFVEFRVSEGAGDGAYVTGLAVTGTPPALQTMPSIQVGTDSATGLYAGAKVDNDDAAFLPMLQASKGEDYGSNIGSVKLRGAFTTLAVTCMAVRRIGVSKNGGAPTFYTATAETGESGQPPSRAIRVPCDGSVATYHVWDDGVVRNSGGVFAVSGDSTLLDIGLRAAMVQFGDSQTYGSGPGAISSDVETMQVAAALGYAGTTMGVSGLTIEGLLAKLDTWLPAITTRAADVAVLAIGANNAGAGITSTDQANYLACINKLKAKFAGKILCRAILPPNEDPSMADPANALLKSVVTTLADPRVIWVDTKTWSPWGTQDGAHPTAAGYATLAGFAIPAYTTALGL